MPATPPLGSGPRLREAMPRPLLVVFALVCAAALVGAVVLIVDPPERTEVGLFERRPPPRDGATHDVGRIDPVVPPRQQSPLVPPCPQVEGVSVVAGVAGVERIRQMLRAACRLSSGTTPRVELAVRQLRLLTIRFAAFARSGVESSLDEYQDVLYLNARFASTEIPVTHAVPLLLHEASHGELVSECSRDCPPVPPNRPGVSAGEELQARRVELEACRHLIPLPDWPRWCRDARAITELPEAEALRRLRAAGFS